MTNFIYSQYVFDDFLLSPVNGYKCKSLVNNKGTIKKFGFDSIEHLHNLYPKFPLRCISSQLKFNNQSNNGRKNNLKKNNVSINIEKYLLNPKKCNQCSNELPYNKRHNSFCSKSCSASYNNSKRVISSSHKLKTSLSLKNTIRSLKRKNYCEIKLTNCKYCQNNFYQYYQSNKVYCSKECRVTNTILSRKYINGKRKNISYFSKYDDSFINLESSWELTIAEYLDSKNIRWSRPKPITWFDSENKSHLYFPDFYLVDYNVYLDPKNPYCMMQDTEKMKKVKYIITLYFGNVEYLLSIINNLI